jgi:hypothetical protein
LRASLAPEGSWKIMDASRLSLFCDTALAERIERVEAQLVAQGSQAAHHRAVGSAGFVIPVAGGVASFAEDGSPLNKVAGLGFGGVPTTAALEEMERAFAARGAPVQVELAHLANPAIGALLTDRGYRLTSFEHVLGLSLTGQPRPVTPPGIEVRPSRDDEFEPWLDVVAEGFAHPDTQGVPSHEQFPREVIARTMRDLTAAAGVMRYVALRYVALRDGVLAGGASVRLAQGLAQLTGAATAPAHRRQGVQTALLSARLADAAAGCDIAVITTQPGSRSQQNAQRQGFELLYTRAILVKHPHPRRTRNSMTRAVPRKRIHWTVRAVPYLGRNRPGSNGSVRDQRDHPCFPLGPPIARRRSRKQPGQAAMSSYRSVSFSVVAGPAVYEGLPPAHPQL